VLGRTDFGHAVVDALNARPGATAKPLDKALIKPVTTTNAGQAALRPLDSGLKLDKLSAALPGWKPRTVKEAINDWLDNPMGLPLGQ
jgi:dTDP-4-dehydrorhamnose reductase